MWIVPSLGRVSDLANAEESVRAVAEEGMNF